MATVHWFTDVISELLTNFLYGIACKLAIRLELRIATFAYSEGQISVIPHHTQFSLWHGSSLAYRGGVA